MFKKRRRWKTTHRSRCTEQQLVLMLEAYYEMLVYDAVKQERACWLYWSERAVVCLIFEIMRGWDEAGVTCLAKTALEV
jgi:hypothetical protein